MVVPLQPDGSPRVRRQRGPAVNNFSQADHRSGAGRNVVSESLASNLVSGHTNGVIDCSCMTGGVSCTKSPLMPEITRGLIPNCLSGGVQPKSVY